MHVDMYLTLELTRDYTMWVRLYDGANPHMVLTHIVRSHRRVQTPYM